MARPLRIEYPNACYHVINRGHEHQAIFRTEAMASAFMNGVAEACQRFNVEVHAYCVLNNEYHLLLKTPEGNLSRFMRQVDGMYTQYYQRARQLSGSIFRSRYKAVLVQAEDYLLPVSRYIHCLPGRRRRNAGEHPWSSRDFYAHSRRDRDRPWLQRQDVMAQLGPGPKPAQRYQQYLEAGVDEVLQHFYGRKNLLSVLGDDKFRDRARSRARPERARGEPKGAAARQRPNIRQVVRVVADHYQVSEESIYHAARGPGSKNMPRWMAMYLCQELSGVTLQAIAQRFGLKRYGTVSTTIGKLKQELHVRPQVNTAVKKLSVKLSSQ